MRKYRVAKITLSVLGALLCAVFAGTLIHDAIVLSTHPYGSFGLEFTAIMSGFIFLMPGVICIVIAIVLHKTQNV